MIKSLTSSTMREVINSCFNTSEVLTKPKTAGNSVSGLMNDHCPIKGIEFHQVMVLMDERHWWSLSSAMAFVNCCRGTNTSCKSLSQLETSILGSLSNSTRFVPRDPGQKVEQCGTREQIAHPQGSQPRQTLSVTLQSPNFPWSKPMPQATLIPCAVDYISGSHKK